MSHRWSKESTLQRLELHVDDRRCRVCGERMHVCAHRQRRVFTLGGPLHLVLRLRRCPVRKCRGRETIHSPEAESSIAMPYWAIGWDVLSWIGHRRFARHWSVPQIRAELSDTYAIGLSEDAIEKSIRRYQVMLAARQQDPQRLQAEYDGVDELILSIDGLQPEKGHETLYVVRELARQRVWFAEPLLSSSAGEVGRLLLQARQWTERLGKPIRLWMSDKQDAFVTGIAAQFPGVPHRYCQNHFLRDLAKPVLEMDGHAKVKMRSRVRGLRSIERGILETRASSSAPPGNAGKSDEPRPDPPADAGDVVLDYCAVVRGILNDDQGGPLHPSGMRMAQALAEVRQSLQRGLDLKKGATPNGGSSDWPVASTKG